MSITQPENLLIVTLLGACGYLLSRQFTGKDKMENSIARIEESFKVSIDGLNRTVGGLSIAIADLKSWTADRYVTQREYEQDKEETRLRCMKHAEVFIKELEVKRES